MKKTRSGKDEDEQVMMLHRPMISKNEMALQHFHVHLDDEIGEPSMYRDLVTILFNATENDMITLYVNSPGGDMTSAMAIIEGIKVTKAAVRCIVLGACHSAASMISMYAHEIIVLDSAHSLVHTASFGSIGNSNNIKTHTDFTVKQIEKFIHATYDGFLTEAELVTVKAGVELWFDADQIRERITKRNKFLENKEKKEEAEAKKSAVKKVVAVKTEAIKPETKKVKAKDTKA